MIRAGFLLLFCSFYGNLQAQKFIEKVYLKDSITVYEGYIVAQAPTKYLRIYRLLEKDTLQVEMDAIWKITKQYASRYNSHKLDPNHIDRHYKALYLELFGRAASVYSVNFDMRTEKGRRNGWGINAGLSIVGSTGSNGGIAAIVPFGINYLIGKKKHFIEVGAGATYMSLIGNNISPNSSWGIFGLSIDEPQGGLFGNFAIGYRFMPLTKGITCRATFNPLVFDGYLEPLFGFSIGYQFW